jgi:excinuclease ABC subunit B
MNIALNETRRRRKIQSEYIRKNNITPEGIKKDIRMLLASIYEPTTHSAAVGNRRRISGVKDIPKEIEKLKIRWTEAARRLVFEQAAQCATG